MNATINGGGRETREEELRLRIEGDREHRKSKTRLQNKILETRKERLKLTKQHQQDYLLTTDLKSYESKLDSLVSKGKYTIRQTCLKRKEELKLAFDEKKVALDKEVLDLTSKLNQYRRLDESLLAEYRKVKDELECQNLLIDLEGGNIDILSTH